MQLLSAARPAISRRGLSRVQQLTVSATMQPTRVLSKEVATDPGARPALARSGACAAVVDSGRSLLMFGGYVEAAEEGAPPSRDPTNEVWVFHAEGLAWRRLEPTAAADGALPQPRIVSQAVAVGQQVWVLGGWDPSDKATGGILGDIWRLDLGTCTWARVEAAGEPFQPASRFQAVALGPRIYIHTHRCLDMILVLDTAAEPPTLSSAPVLPDPQHGAPSSRGLHSLTAVGSRLFLFGGAPQHGPMLADLWVLDTTQQPLRWRAVAAEGPTPHARCSHAAAAVGQQLVIAGGSYYREDGSGLQPLGDMWALDTEALAWRELSVQGSAPNARNAAVMGALAGGRLLLHGGWWPFRETYNGTYLMELEQ